MAFSSFKSVVNRVTDAAKTAKSQAEQNNTIRSVAGAARALKTQAEEGLASTKTFAEQGLANARSQAEQGLTNARSQVGQGDFAASVGRKAGEALGRVRSVVSTGTSSGTSWTPIAFSDSSLAALPPLQVRICSWNLHGNVIAPEDDVESWLVPSPDRVAHIYVIGVQELVELGPKSTILNATGDDVRQQALEARIEQALSTTGSPFIKVCSFGMVGLALLIYIREEVAPHLRDLDCDRVKTGLDGQFGNKGCVCARFVVGSMSMCFTNVHLASGLHATYERTQHLVQVLADGFQGTQSFKGNTRPPKLGFKRESKYTIENHHFSAILGDFNSRLNRPDEEKETWPDGPPDAWLELDQLLLGYYPCLSDRYREGMIAFPPTYKYIPRTDKLSEKRCPAWTDRVFYRVTRKTEANLLEYDSYAKLATTSDHRPIVAHFLICLVDQPSPGGELRAHEQRAQEEEQQQDAPAAQAASESIDADTLGAAAASTSQMAHSADTPADRGQDDMPKRPLEEYPQVYGRPSADCVGGESPITADECAKTVEPPVARFCPPERTPASSPAGTAPSRTSDDRSIDGGIARGPSASDGGLPAPVDGDTTCRTDVADGESSFAPIEQSTPSRTDAVDGTQAPAVAITLGQTREADEWPASIPSLSAEDDELGAPKLGT